MDPYKILGLCRNATCEVIERAFRKAILAQGHPDNGGDADRLQQLKLARDVLCDPARRAKCDATGTIDQDKPDNAYNEALAILGRSLNAVLIQCLQQDVDPATEDLPKHIRTALAARQKEIAKTLGVIAKGRAMLETLAGRFTAREGGDCALAQVVETMRIGADRDAKALDCELVFLKRALEMLEGCEFRFDPNVRAATWGAVRAYTSTSATV